MDVMIKPIGDNILVKPDKTEEVTSGGIYIPEMSQRISRTGTVIECGKGFICETTGKLIPNDVKPGDRVFYGQFSGRKYKHEETEYLFLKNSEILMTIGAN